jgi:hypothetical protein
MAKKTARRKAGGSSRKRTGQSRKRTSSNKRAGSAARASARAGKTKRVAAKRRSKPAAKSLKAKKKASPARQARSTQDLRDAAARSKNRGMERDLAQTPEAGRSVRGPTNPMPTRRSTGTEAGAGSSRRAPGLDRARRKLREVEETVPGPPSSLDLDRRPSAARSGRRELQESRREHNEVSPDLTAGDVDADWEDAYSVGDEAPGGDNPTPDQDRVDDIGKALGVQYDDNEELKASDKISQRDKHRWELDPASSDDYRDRD